VLLPVVVLGSASNNGLTSQITNVLPAVSGFTAGQTSALPGLAGVLNIGMTVLAGRWMKRSGTMAAPPRPATGSWGLAPAKPAPPPSACPG
jgi:hypothetical protein